MILPLAVWLLRCVGWTAAAGSVVLVTFIICWQALGGPEAGQSLWPAHRAWRCYANTIWIASGATVCAFVISMPAAFALVQARHAWQRSLLYTLTIIPLITMPAVFAYAWLLLATARDGTMAAMLQALGWNTPGAEPMQAAWVLGTWLWPVPALFLAATFRRHGVQAYRMATLDATPPVAFVRGALPVMRAPLIAIAAIVFIIAAMDATVPPLMFAGDVWSVEMTAAAWIAAGHGRPVAFLLWQAWPMLATIMLVAALAIPSIRQMASWADDDTGSGSGTAAPASHLTWALASAIAVAISLFPIAVFTTELAATPTDTFQVFATAYKTFCRAGMATGIVALLAGAASLALAVCTLDEPDGSRARRWVSRILTALVILVAVLPPEVVASALVTVFTHPRISPTHSWNIYDNSPFVWAAAMVARFAFVPVCVARLINRRVPESLTAHARSDGATFLQRLAYVRMPVLWGPLLAASLLVMCLTLSEVSASVLVQPPQFLGGSLAFEIDAQMHYGRQSETIALSLMWMVPPVLIAAVAPILARRHAQRWSVGRKRPRKGRSLPSMRKSSILTVVAILSFTGCRRTEPDLAAVKGVFGSTGLGAGEFSYPRGIATSPVDGCVYVVDKSARIQRFSRDGAFQIQWRMPEYANGKPTGIYVDHRDRIWVPDTHYSRVIVFDRDGGELFRFGERGEGPGQFVYPTAVVLDDLGNIYVGEYGGNDRISKFAPDRTYQYSFAERSSGEGAVERPTEIALDEDGAIWVADACHHRICKYDRDGRFLSAFGSPGTGAGNLNYPYGLVLEAAGTILVADRGNNRIVRFDRSGGFLGSWGTPGRGLGQILQPWGVAVDKDNRIYCLDSYNNRVQVIDW